MSYPHLTKTLVESFNALADEVQSLIDRKTILEHKLRYAHEQYQYIADRYAPASTEISEILSKLQLPPELHHSILETSNFVPLPTRGRSDTQHQIALFIREGKKVAQQLSDLTETSKGSGSSKEALSSSSKAESMTSLSTVLEQDFTVEGRKGLLECPFSKKETVAEEPNGVPCTASAGEDPTPHQSADPICAAMYEETMSAPAPSAENGGGSASKCPIRFLDQHSPEEIAQYVEKHKHQIPRSHEVCVRRYQKSQEQIRKLDAKYGNLASMIQGLSHLHQPMLPTAELEARDGASNERVEDWAHGVSVSEAGDPEKHDQVSPESASAEERESHFDRPLKEVRVGESPSRPWGISVPVYAQPNERDLHPRRTSSSAAPVRMPSPEPMPPQGQGTAARKCPFDHTKLAFPSPFPKLDEHSGGAFDPTPRAERPFTPVKNPFPSASQPPQTLPTFVNAPAPETKEAGPAPAVPQTVFNITGPVFIGYPMEQAMQFLQNYQGTG